MWDSVEVYVLPVDPSVRLVVAPLTKVASVLLIVLVSSRVLVARLVMDVSVLPVVEDTLSVELAISLVRPRNVAVMVLTLVESVALMVYVVSVVLSLVVVMWVVLEPMRMLSRNRMVLLIFSNMEAVMVKVLLVMVLVSSRMSLVVMFVHRLSRPSVRAPCRN